jgi:vacuolar-type H+-ATPase subunit H
MAESPSTEPQRSQSAADRVGAILQAAEQAAEQVRVDAEQRMNARIAEGERAAVNRVQAAEQEADELLADARQSATRSRADAEVARREMLDEARATADAVRSEGLEVVTNLRAMGDSLRANAERLLRDVQTLHGQMISRIEVIEATRQTGGARREERDRVERPRRTLDAIDDADIDVPEFIPKR